MGRENEEEDVGKYWITLRKREDTWNWKRKQYAWFHYITLRGELVLDAVMDLLSADVLCDCDVPGIGVVSRLWPAGPRKCVSIFRRYNGFFFFKLFRQTLGPIKPHVMCLLGPLVFVPCRDSSLSAGGVVHRTTPTHFRPINSQRLHVDGRMLADGVISEGSQQYRNCSVWLFVPLCPTWRTFGWHKQKFNLPCVRRIYSPVPEKQESFPQTISDTNGISKITVRVQSSWTLKWKLASTVD